MTSIVESTKINREGEIDYYKLSRTESDDMKECERCREFKHLHDFQERIIKQLLLTYGSGSVLKIDVTKANEALNEPRPLMYGGGEIWLASDEEMEALK